MSIDTKLRAIIIGSGLAGLTAARILREHHHVSVYERGDASVATSGQGIMVAPNGSKILDQLSFSYDNAGSVPIYGFRIYDKQGNMKKDTHGHDMDLRKWFGADCYGTKRSDLRDELMRLATAPSDELGIHGEPAKMVYENAVVGLEPDEGVVTLADGTTANADVVIVADGVHSRFRETITASDRAVKKTGLTCYRVAVTTEDARRAVGDLGLPHWWDPETSQNRASIIYAGDGTPRMVTVYPLRKHGMYNMSCIIIGQKSTKPEAESWHANANGDDVVRHFGDFDERLKLVLGNATEVKVWELQDLDPLPTWTRGRAILIGDAAHAMTPMQGQGGNMSIEDAEAMRLLAPGTKRQDVPEILKVVESVRKPRTERVLADTRKSHKDLNVTDQMERGSDMDFAFNFGYNGIHAALEAKRKQETEADVGQKDGVGEEEDTGKQ